MVNKNINISKDFVLIGTSITLFLLAFLFNIYGVSGIMNLTGYGSSGDYTNPVESLTGSVETLSGETLTGATQVTFSNAVKLTSGSVNVVIPNGVVVQTQSGTAFDATKITTSVIPSVPVALDTTERDVGKIKFGVDGVKLNFTKPIKLEIPADTNLTTVKIKAKHAGEVGYDTSSLTDSFSSTCLNGVATPSSNIAPVSNGIATIYTCSASDFVAIIPKTTSGGGGGGGGLFKDNCPNGDFSPSYYDNTCGTPPTISEEKKLEVVLNTTPSDKAKFDIYVKSKVKSGKYKTYNLVYIEGYDFSKTTLALSKKIIDAKNITKENKTKVINALNKFIVAKYTYMIAETKTESIKVNYTNQIEELKNALIKAFKK